MCGSAPCLATFTCTICMQASDSCPLPALYPLRCPSLRSSLPALRPLIWMGPTKKYILFIVCVSDWVTHQMCVGPTESHIRCGWVLLTHTSPKMHQMGKFSRRRVTQPFSPPHPPCLAKTSLGQKSNIMKSHIKCGWVVPSHTADIGGSYGVTHQTWVGPTDSHIGCW